jgi:hypothetical protein
MELFFAKREWGIHLEIIANDFIVEANIRVP